MSVDVLTAVIMKATVLWDVICSVLDSADVSEKPAAPIFATDIGT